VKWKLSFYMQGVQLKVELAIRVRTTILCYTECFLNRRTARRNAGGIVAALQLMIPPAV
jgi:hypothetical protein